jgi:hypothetical protein
MPDTQHLIGHLLDEDYNDRDAIHIAVYPAVARGFLEPAAPVHLVEGGRADNCSRNSGDCIGIVDPYLRRQVRPGQRFFVFLMPNTITSLRHVWTLPAIDRTVGDLLAEQMREVPVRAQGDVPRGGVTGRPLPLAHDNPFMSMEEIDRMQRIINQAEHNQRDDSVPAVLAPGEYHIPPDVARDLINRLQTEVNEARQALLRERAAREAENRSVSEAWLRNFCGTREFDIPYETLMAAIMDDPRTLADGPTVHVDNIAITIRGDISGDRDIPEEFWRHVEVVLGCPPAHRPFTFSCSC